MRDVLLTIIVFAWLPVILARPWTGIIMWSWLGYMNPHLLTFGFAQNFPFAYIVAIVTLVGLVFTSDRQWPYLSREVWLLLAFWGFMLVTTLNALYPEDAWEQWVKVSKIFLMALVALVLITTRERLRLLLLTMVLSIGVYGLKGGVWFVLSGGLHAVYGPGGEGAFISSNNAIGLALNMSLPLLVVLRHEEQRPWLRRLLLAIVIASCVAVVGTYSRGALLGLIVVAFLLVGQPRSRMVMVGVLGLGLVFGSIFLPDRWFGRMQTIREYEADESAVSRLDAWRLATEIAQDLPLGGGFRPFTPEVWNRYVQWTRISRGVGYDAHSIYFQVLGEHGFGGLGLYLSLIAATLLSLRGLIQRARARPETLWIAHYARAIRVSLAAYLVNGAFLSFSYFDFFYHLVIVTVLLKQFLARASAMSGEGAGIGGGARAAVGSVRGG